MALDKTSRIILNSSVESEHLYCFYFIRLEFNFLMPHAWKVCVGGVCVCIYSSERERERMLRELSTIREISYLMLVRIICDKVFT